MSAPRLVEDDAERARRFGVVGAGEQELSAADDHRQGIVELVAGPGGELAQGVELALLAAASSVSTASRNDATTVWSRRSSSARSGTMAAQDPQACRAVSEATRRLDLGCGRDCVQS